jgi:DNA-binding XRE family transcriptional regulator
MWRTVGLRQTIFACALREVQGEMGRSVKVIVKPITKSAVNRPSARGASGVYETETGTETGTGKCVTSAALADRLAALFEQSGKTQEEFAKLIGISQPMLSQILNGDRMPGDSVLRWMGMRHVDHYQEERGERR